MSIDLKNQFQKSSKKYTFCAVASTLAASIPGSQIILHDPSSVTNILAGGSLMAAGMVAGYYFHQKAEAITGQNAAANQNAPVSVSPQSAQTIINKFNRASQLSAMATGLLVTTFALCQLHSRTVGEAALQMGGTITIAAGAIGLNRRSLKLQKEAASELTGQTASPKP